MKKRPPRLKQLAADIERLFPDLVTRISKERCNTDRKIAGTRLIHPGKGRWGNRLVVTERRTGRVVLDHDSAETYRHNGEVVRWIEKRKAERKKARRPRQAAMAADGTETLTEGELRVLEAAVQIFRKSDGCYVEMGELQNVLKLKSRRSLSGYVSSLTKKGYLNHMLGMDDCELSNKTRKVYGLKGHAANG